MLKKEIWRESDLAALPEGEQDYFERKSGQLFESSDWRDNLAKAVSAFANSGGGHLIIGVENNGRIDGVARNHKGKQSTKDWLEQIIPDLVTYGLQDFSVHEVVPDAPLEIPLNHVVIVIDIGDSPQAPHQTAHTKDYYYRAGGRSEKAQHHYLEMLRSRT